MLLSPAIVLSAFLVFVLGALPEPEDGMRFEEHFTWRRGGPMEMKLVPLQEDQVHIRSTKRAGRARVDGESLVGASAALDITDEAAVGLLWNRSSYREEFFNLTPADDEHVCFKGFQSMIETTTTCRGWQRQYPSEKSVQERPVPIWVNDSITMSNFTLDRVPDGAVNVWHDEGLATVVKKAVTEAVDIFVNTNNLPILTVDGSASWMEHECKALGSFPFMFTCANRLNIVVVNDCDKGNRKGRHSNFCYPFDAFLDYPLPVQENASVRWDSNIYLCSDAIEKTYELNPYELAKSIVFLTNFNIQLGMGMHEIEFEYGIAAWAVAGMLGLSPPLMNTGRGDWNSINAEHIHTFGTRGRYVNGMLLTYLEQENVLGRKGIEAIMQHRFWDRTNIRYGRGNYDYFLSSRGKGVPTKFEPIDLDIVSTDYPYAEVLLDYRVALTSACFSDKRPTEAKYMLPERLANRSIWDCTAYPVYWANEVANFPSEVSQDMFYGGAAMYRVAYAHNATFTMPEVTDRFIRTKVMAQGDECGNEAEVKELTPGNDVSFTGSCARDIYVIQVNVDPMGELWSREEITASVVTGVKRSDYLCVAPCVGEAWAIRAENGSDIGYNANLVVGIQTQKFQLPADSDPMATFHVMWHMEEGYTKPDDGCGMAGWDGVQIRIQSFNASGVFTEYVVVDPTTGPAYEKNSLNHSAIREFSRLFPERNCDDWRGWTGISANFSLEKPVWHTIGVNLTQFVGQMILIELFFVSDGYAGGDGFWVDGVVVKDEKTGDTVYDKTGDEDDGMNPSSEVFLDISTPPKAGEQDIFSRVPVAVGYPEGFFADKTQYNITTRKAPWSATWSTPPAGDTASRPRAYVGQLVSSTKRKNHILRIQQEACQPITAPLKGVLSKVTVYIGGRKIGWDQLKLHVRNPGTYEPIPGFEPMLSPSEQVTDHRIHNFYPTDQSGFCQGLTFLICCGIGRTRTLFADDGLEPFLWLPLTYAPGIGGTTVLLDLNGDKIDGQTAPWGADWTTQLRAEFVQTEECVDHTPPTPPTPAPTPVSGSGTNYGVIIGVILVLALLVGGGLYGFSGTEEVGQETNEEVEMQEAAPAEEE